MAYIGGGTQIVRLKDSFLLTCAKCLAMGSFCVSIDVQHGHGSLVSSRFRCRSVCQRPQAVIGWPFLPSKPQKQAEHCTFFTFLYISLRLLAFFDPLEALHCFFFF